MLHQQLREPIHVAAAHRLRQSQESRSNVIVASDALVLVELGVHIHRDSLCVRESRAGVAAAGKGSNTAAARTGSRPAPPPKVKNARDSMCFERPDRDSDPVLPSS